MPGDQRYEDALSVRFDTEILEQEFAIAGPPKIELTICVDKPEAQIAVRLNDIWPDGAATRMTYGVLNLTHRDSHGVPEPMVPVDQ